MYQPPSQEIKQPLDSLTRSPSKTSTALLENFDESGWSRACDKFMLASIDITHLDGTFPASPDENSTGPLTVENDQAPPSPDVQEDSDDEVKSLDVKYVESRKVYNQAQTQRAQFQQQVQQPKSQQAHQAALLVALPASQAPLLQRPQKLVLQGHRMPLPVCQLAPQATVSASSTSNQTICELKYSGVV
ncbi:unnamed protein product [Caenorhabditis brenneri]